MKKREGYTLDEGTIQWARTREHQLRSGIQEMGFVLEKNALTIDGLLDGADSMDDQPESDRLRSIAADMNKLLDLLRQLHEDSIEDQSLLAKAIAKFDQMEKEG